MNYTKKLLHYKQILPAPGWRTFGVQSEHILVPRPKIWARSCDGEMVIEEVPIVGWVLPEPWEDTAGVVHRDEIELPVAWRFDDADAETGIVCSISEACRYDDGFLAIWPVAPGHEFGAAHGESLRLLAECGLEEKRAMVVGDEERRRIEQAAMSEPVPTTAIQ